MPRRSTATSECHQYGHFIGTCWSFEALLSRPNPSYLSDPSFPALFSLPTLPSFPFLSSFCPPPRRFLIPDSPLPHSSKITSSCSFVTSVARNGLSLASRTFFTFVLFSIVRRSCCSAQKTIRWRSTCGPLVACWPNLSLVARCLRTRPPPTSN